MPEKIESSVRKSSQDEDVYLTPQNMLDMSIRKNALGQVIPRKAKNLKSKDWEIDENGYTLARTESWEEEIKTKSKYHNNSRNIEHLTPRRTTVDKQRKRRNCCILQSFTTWRCRKSIIVTGFILILILAIGILSGLILYRENGR